MSRKVVLELKKLVGDGCREGVSWCLLSKSLLQMEMVEEKVASKIVQFAWEPNYGQDLGAPHGLHAACGLPRQKFHKPGVTSSSERGAYLELFGDLVVDDVTC